MKAVELWNITGDVKMDSLGNKTINTTIKFQANFSLQHNRRNVHG